MPDIFIEKNHKADIGVSLYEPEPGRTYLNIREYYFARGDRLPTKKGICIDVSKVDELISAINKICNES